MLITFSKPVPPQGDFFDVVQTVTRQHTHGPNVTWARGQEVRFTLPGATTAQHEAVILALLNLDPRATIRTSRARYAGLYDYVRQNAGKLAFHHVDGDPLNNTISNLRVVQTRDCT